MDSEILIDEVLKELYKKLSIKENVLHCSQKPRLKLVLIGSLTSEEKDLLGKEFDIFPFSSSFYQQSLSYSVVLISHMTLEELASLALGYSLKPEGNVILQTLLLDKPVYLLEHGLEYRKYKNTAHKTLYHLYQDYEKKILQYGILLVSTVMELLTGSITAFDINFPVVEIDFTSKNLLLEADLLKMNRRNLFTLRLRKTCIITPSAADFIRNHNIKIIKQ